MKKANIILIGANGFFGKNIQLFLKNKYNFKNIKRNDNFKNLNFQNFTHVINCAAEVYNDKKMMENNSLLVDVLLKKMINQNKLIKLIHFGSSAEYGLLHSPAKETNQLKPRTVYEATKASSCLLVKGYSDQYKLNSVIIRPFSIYGPHENLTRLLPNIFRHFMFNDNLRIFGGYHDFVYINDMIRFIDILLKKNHKFYDGKIINFGSGKQYSNYQILKICEKIFKKIEV